MEFSAVVLALMKRQQNSGVSISEYAKEIGIASATLYKWRQGLSGKGSKRQPLPLKPDIEVIRTLVPNFLEMKDIKMVLILLAYSANLSESKLKSLVGGS